MEIKINRTEKKTTFKVKLGHYFVPLTLETMRLFGS